VRIDPGVECPQARDFKFDPVDAALATRLAIAHAVLVLVQAYHAAGSPALGRGDAGFSEWNRLVRRVVLWLQAEGYAEESGFGVLGDPAHSILEAASADDPDTEAARMLLTSLDETFHGESFTAREVYSLYATGRGDVFEALHAILGKRDVTPISVGRTLANRRDKIVGGLVLRRLGEDKRGTVWMVVSV
jgi:putative DNA primase/helicase